MAKKYAYRTYVMGKITSTGTYGRSLVKM